jgi:hypothetical protein
MASSHPTEAALEACVFYLLESGLLKPEAEGSGQAVVRSLVEDLFRIYRGDEPLE